MDADSQIQLGNDLFRRGDLSGALARYEEALAMTPGHARAHYNMGLVLQGLDRPQEAMRHYAAAVDAQPGMAKALVNWGNVLKDLGQLHEAEALYRRALAVDPHDLHALNNMGSIAQERGDMDAAEAFYDRAAKAHEGSADPRYNLALLALRRGEFARGWDEYEQRFRTNPPVVVPHASPLPRAQAQNLRPGRRVAVAREQGVGDQLLFSTLLPELSARGVTAVVETDTRLLAAFRRSLPGIAFVAPSEAQAAFRECDCQLPLGSLPQLMRRARTDFAGQPSALLAADADRIERARRELGAGCKIGISWRSFQGRGRKHIEDRKSAGLERFGLFASPGLSLVDLQYGDVEEERRAFDARYPGLRRELQGLDRFNDLEGVMGAIAACDMVITTSNVTAHLAGALGKRTWLVYPGANAPFHYWVADSNGRSLWYPAVKIVTSAQWMGWSEAFEAIAERLGRQELA